jgi:hypothetical protein
MKTCWLQQLLSLILVVFACAGFGVEGTGARALLQPSGKVQVNGNPSRRTTTLFSGDLVETEEGSAANIVAGGSSVLVMPGTAIKFLGNGVELTQGGMSIATSEAMTATVDGLTITPSAQKISKFEVTEDDDTVLIAARQGNVAVSDGQQTSTVPEGQEDKRKKKEKGGGAAPAGGGHSISGKTLAIIGGLAAGGTVAGILIAEKGKQQCLSSSGNKKCVCKKNDKFQDVCTLEG